VLMEYPVRDYLREIPSRITCSQVEKTPLKSLDTLSITPTGEITF
jgi:hypothetical protein